MKRTSVYARMRDTTLITTEEEIGWEARPGGMLVQKRSHTSHISAAPNLRLRIIFGAIRFEISLNSRSTFGEVKKLVMVETRLQPGEQRVMFKGKERQNGEYLDMCGVKDKSKVTIIEDPASVEKRCIEMAKNIKTQTARRAISDISIEVDQLEEQVDAIDKSVTKGIKVPEVQITTLIEMLMRQALKLDTVSSQGDLEPYKHLEGKRVQKCVESLDVLKMSNARVMKPVGVTTTTTTKWEIDSSSLTASQWELFD